MSDYKEFKVPDGKAYCWQVKERKSTYSPEFKGTMVLTRSYQAGETIKLAVWSQETKTGKPWGHYKCKNVPHRKCMDPIWFNQDGNGWKEQVK